MKRNRMKENEMIWLEKTWNKNKMRCDEIKDKIEQNERGKNRTKINITDEKRV